MSKEKKKGRPTKYNPDTHDDKAYDCAVSGMIDTEIAKELGIHVSTLYEWIHKHDGLRESVEKGKKSADRRVKEALYKRAIGYFDETGEFHPPDVRAQQYWLNNRDPDKWRNNHNVNLEISSFAEWVKSCEEKEDE